MYKPIVVIGAPRSGTNMLRDILCTIDGVGTWPCDEINYIWRHGNVSAKSDEFTPQMATPKVIKYIVSCFDKLANTEQLSFVVEKTCANSLRVSFVDQILPNAHYVFIRRDGLDVVASAKLRWKASLDIPYLIKKVKYVPIVDLPIYSTRYIWSHIYRKLSGKKRLSFWGPQLRNMNDLISKHSLDEICAIQWKQCVESAERQISLLPKERVSKIRYENFVNNPESELRRICDDAMIIASDADIKHAVLNVSSKSVGKWKKQLSDEVVDALEPLIK